MPNIHDASNATIGAMPDVDVIGRTKAGIKITSLQIMIPSGSRTKYEAIVRASDRTIVGRVQSETPKELRTYLAAEMNIGLKYTDLILAQAVDLSTRFEEAELYNQAAKDLSPGMIGQFQANGVMYSIVHNPEYKLVFQDAKADRTNPQFFTAYAQKAVIEDPDECLISTDSFDTLFDAMAFIRNHIDKALFAEFMPGVA